MTLFECHRQAIDMPIVDFQEINEYVRPTMQTLPCETDVCQVDFLVLLQYNLVGGLVLVGQTRKDVVQKPPLCDLWYKGNI